MSTKTRWELPIRTVLGERRVVLVAQDGMVLATGPGTAKMSPEDVSGLRRILAEAQAEALRQRGGF